jgi:hypothetical protein
MLGFLGNCENINQSVVHLLDWRRLGCGAMAQEDQEIPLPLWPLILAKSRQYEDELWRPASVIFRLLQEHGAAIVRDPSERKKK